MKKIMLIFAALLIPAAVFIPYVYALEADVIYTEGWVDVKQLSGDVSELFIGDVVFSGETVITGNDGVAELEPQSGSRITVKPDTVFSVRETEAGGSGRSIMHTTIGEVAFKFNRMTSEPDIVTPSMTAGVRGTEFTVFAGADGSTLIAVGSGAVEVAGMGRSVMLQPDEGVEVRPGRAPGAKFPVFEGKIDYSSWNGGRIAAMMDDPQSALESLAVQLQQLEKQTDRWASEYAESRARLEELRLKQKSLFDQERAEEARKLNTEEVRPLEYSTSRLVLNYRYYALSALSFRQHVLSGFYARMKAAYITDRQNPAYTAFLSAYAELTESFEEKIGPYLGEADY